MKILLFPILLSFACGLAGIYGVIHNQISFTVAPAYFFEFKFNQFRIDPAFHNRIGAGSVGFMASWWMGLLIGFPIYVAALFVRGTRCFVRSYVMAALLVVCVTLATGLGALVYAYAMLDITSLPPWMDNRDISTPVRFARAGMMHNFSYLGGLIGLVAGLVYTVRQAWVSRRKPAVTV